MQRILNVVSSVAVRLFALVLALGLITGGTAYVANKLSQDTRTALTELDQAQLPALRGAGDVARATTDMTLGLMPLLSAAGQTDLDLAYQAAMTAVASLQSATETLPESAAANLRSVVTTSIAEIEALYVSRTDEFSARRNLDQETANIGRAAESVAAALESAANAAVSDLAAGADETISRLKASLGKLIGVDVQNVGLIYGLTANSNLATGTALALSQTRDPAVRSILQDLRTSALNGIQDNLPRILDIENVEIDASVIEAAMETWAKDVSGSVVAERQWRAEILERRTSLDRMISNALDELLFNLEIDSEITAADDEEAIQQLIDVHVNNLRNIGELSEAAASQRAGLYRIRTASDISGLTAAAGQLSGETQRLIDVAQFAPDNVQGDVSVMIAAADPAQGIAALQQRVLDTQAAAIEASQRAADAVMKIEGEARTLSDGAIATISNASSSLLAQADEGKQLLNYAIMVALAVIAASFVLIYLWVVRPMLRVTATTERLAHGDLDVVQFSPRDRSEIGRMRQALSYFRESLLENQVLQEQAEKERLQQQKQQELIVSSLAEGLHGLAEGDLTTQITVSFPGEYERLRVDFNEAVTKLCRAICQISESGAMIRDSSNEISSASQDLAQRTERSACELEEASNALGSLSNSISEAAQRAEDAMQLTKNTSVETAQSVTVVHDTVSAMQQIAQSSEEVKKINALINDIAFQTNLLALNAGVEAARAGEAGKGFAVVASEVRALAQRSTEAAQEIGSLLTQSATNIEEGVDLVNRTEGALTSIGELVDKVNAEVAEIAAATKTQSKSVQEVNESVQKLDGDTQNNAAMFEETTAASVSLKEEASAMANAILGFRTQVDTPETSAETNSPSPEMRVAS